MPTASAFEGFFVLCAFIVTLNPGNGIDIGSSMSSSSASAFGNEAMRGFSCGLIFGFSSADCRNFGRNLDIAFAGSSIVEWNVFLSGIIFLHLNKK
jgi:hypothetical protein